MIDPFVAGHRAKAAAEVKAAEVAEKAAKEARAKAKYEATMNAQPKPGPQPYVPQKAPWTQ